MEVATNPEQVAQIIAEGLATESDTGLALRSVQTALGCSLLTNVNSVNAKFNQLNDILERCIDRFNRTIEPLLLADTIDRRELFDIITTLQKNQVAYLELQRKIVQSPTKLFSDDLLSSEERKLLSLIKSFKSEDEKRKFLAIVEQALIEKDNEYE